jgi:hypothetical protein
MGKVLLVMDRMKLQLVFLLWAGLLAASAAAQPGDAASPKTSLAIVRAEKLKTGNQRQRVVRAGV